MKRVKLSGISCAMTAGEMVMIIECVGIKDSGWRSIVSYPNYGYILKKYGKMKYKIQNST